jgi:hypothetical protein
MIGAGLNSQIKAVEHCIELKEKKHQDVSFEKGLVKAWKKWEMEHGDRIEAIVIDTTIKI